jgi:hypothetical protein
LGNFVATLHVATKLNLYTNSNAQAHNVFLIQIEQDGLSHYCAGMRLEVGFHLSNDGAASGETHRFFGPILFGDPIQPNLRLNWKEVHQHPE